MHVPGLCFAHTGVDQLNYSAHDQARREVAVFGLENIDGPKGAEDATLEHCFWLAHPRYA